MTDTEICKKYNIPKSTLQDWKNRDKDNWRYLVYKKLKGLT